MRKKKHGSPVSRQAGWIPNTGFQGLGPAGPRTAVGHTITPLERVAQPQIVYPYITMEVHHSITVHVVS